MSLGSIPGAALRQVLRAALPTESDFSSFLKAAFPELRRRIKRSMDRLAQENYLIESIEQKTLLTALAHYNPHAIALNSSNISTEIFADILPADYSIKYHEFIEVPSGYAGIIIDNRCAFFHLSKHETTRQLFDKLYIKHLVKKFPPYTYGQTWVLGTGGNGIYRLVLPINWVIQELKDPAWIGNATMATFGLRSGFLGSVVSLEKLNSRNCYLCVIAFNSHCLLELESCDGIKFKQLLYCAFKNRVRTRQPSPTLADELSQKNYQNTYLLSHGFAEVLYRHLSGERSNDNIIVLEEFNEKPL